MRKICFVLPSFAGGGAERVMLHLARGLDRAHHDVKLVVWDARGPLREQADGLSIIDLESPRLRQAVMRLRRSLADQRPDVVVSVLGYANLAVLALCLSLRHKPAVIVREANPPEVTVAALPLPAPLARAAYRFLYRRATAILCPSAPVADALAALCHLPRQHLAVLSNPVDHDVLRRAAATPRRASESGPRFVAAGRLARQKGYDRLFDLLAGLRGDWHLTLFGEGPERAALQAQAERNSLSPRIRFAGFSPVPWPDYAGADAFLLPSRWEGMSNAALEALAVGTPVIGMATAGGLREVAKHAPPGAVTIAETEAEFLAAMAAVEAHPVRAPRPSLLPDDHRLDAVIHAFTRIVATAARRSP